MKIDIISALIRAHILKDENLWDSALEALISDESQNEDVELTGVILEAKNGLNPSGELTVNTHEGSPESSEGAPECPEQILIRRAQDSLKVACEYSRMAQWYLRNITPGKYTEAFGLGMELFSEQEYNGFAEDLRGSRAGMMYVVSRLEKRKDELRRR